MVAVSSLQLCGGGQGLECKLGRGQGAGVPWALDNETLTSLHSYCFHTTTTATATSLFGILGWGHL